jgi:Zn-dependent protease
MTGVRSKRQIDIASQAALLLIALTLGALLEVAGPRWAQTILGNVNLDGIASGSAILAALLAAIVTHEAGHLFMAWACGFEILGARLGPLRLERLHGTHKVSVSGSGLFSCGVSAVPRNCEHWRERMMLVVAAGPAATLLGAVGAASVAVFSAPTAWLGTFWSALALLHFLLFVLGLIPNSESAKTRNDATLFLALKRDGTAARELKLYHRLTQLRLAAIRPYDYPPALMSDAAQWKGRPEANVLIARTLSEWALDSEDPALAGVWDRRAVEQSESCDPRLHNSALAASGCVDVLFREDMAAARDKFQKVDFDALFPRYFAYRARAACLLANGLTAQVPAQVILAQYALPRGLAYYDFERMLLDKLHLKALGVGEDSLASPAAARAAAG